MRKEKGLTGKSCPCSVEVRSCSGKSHYFHKAKESIQKPRVLTIVMLTMAITARILKQVNLHFYTTVHKQDDNTVIPLTLTACFFSISEPLHNQSESMMLFQFVFNYALKAVFPLRTGSVPDYDVTLTQLTHNKCSHQGYSPSTYGYLWIYTLWVKFKISSWFKDHPLMLQTRHSDNVMPELCWSPKLQKAQLSLVFFTEQENAEP